YKKGDEGSKLRDNIKNDEYDLKRLEITHDELAYDSPLYSTNNLSSSSLQVSFNDQEFQGTISKLEEFYAQIIMQKKILNVELKHLKSFSNSLTTVDLIRYTQTKENFHFLRSVNNPTKRLLSKESDQRDEEEAKIEESPMLNKPITTSSQSSQKDQDTTPMLQQLYFQIQNIIAKRINSQIKLRSLSIVNTFIRDLLMREFKVKLLVFLQSPEEYIKRDIMSRLPAEYSSYTEYTRSKKLNSLSTKTKER
ncbi:1720_t:CDS:2, partial [Funneliformis mosseae]